MCWLRPINIGSEDIEPLDTSAIELMELQVNALFRQDGAGRLLSINVPSRHPAPRVFIGRTLDGNVIRFRHDLPNGLVEQLLGLIRPESLPGSDDELERSPGYLDEAVRLLAKHGPAKEVWQGPAWAFPKRLEVGTTPVLQVTAANTGMLARWFPWLCGELDDSWPCLAVVAGDDVVAYCRSVRTASEAVEAGVETVAEYRGRGFAPAAVRAWAAMVRSAGLVPLYSTSWDNLASRTVARKLGLRLYGADLNIS